MRILDRVSVPRYTLPYLSSGANEFNRNQPRMIQRTHDRCPQWTDLQDVAGLEYWWGRPILGSHTEITFPEYDGGKLDNLIGRDGSSARQPHFYGSPGPSMHSM